MNATCEDKVYTLTNTELRLAQMMKVLGQLGQTARMQTVRYLMRGEAMHHGGYCRGAAVGASAGCAGSRSPSPFLNFHRL
jgi:hypothetical protein